MVVCNASVIPSPRETCRTKQTKQVIRAKINQQQNIIFNSWMAYLIRLCLVGSGGGILESPKSMFADAIK